MTKAAQIHLAQSLATIVSPRIRVNSVSPGVLLTVSRNMQTYSSLLRYKLIFAGGLGTSISRRKDRSYYRKVAAEKAGNGRGKMLPEF